MTDQQPAGRAEFDKIRVAHLFDGARFRFKSSADFALLGLRSVLIANGGALAATLTYIGTTSQGRHFGGAIAAFVAGFVLALMAILAAYAAQSAYGRQEQSGADKIYFFHIGSRELEARMEEQERGHRIRGEMLEWVAIGFYVASIVAFLLGGTVGICALTF